MSDSKIFAIPDGIMHNSNPGLDPNLVFSMMNNNGGLNNGNWVWILFLLFMFGWRGNGFGNGDNGSALSTGYLSSQINDTAGRDLLMLAINGNGAALNNLSTMLNSDINSIKTAINSVQSAISSVGNHVGMSAAQVTNAITTGNMQLAQQLAQCCCDNKLLVTTLGYENLIATLNLTNALQLAINANTVNQQEGFTTIAYLNLTLTANMTAAMNANTLAIKDATNSLTSLILAKLDSIEDARKDREINTLTAQLAAVNAKAEREAELAPIVKLLDQIQCHQPSTVTVLNPSAVAIPTCLAYLMGFGLNPFNFNLTGGSIWS